MKLKIAFTAMALFTLSLQAQAWKISGGNSDDWIASLKPSSSVKEQVSLFWKNHNLAGEPTDYVSSLPSAMKQLTFRQLPPQLGCRDDINVGFINRIFSDSPIAAQRFEAGFLRVESTNCLGRLNLETVFNVFMSDEFQMRTIRGLKGIQSNQKTNQVCQQTSVSVIGNSSYCFTQNIWRNETKIMIHSFNESNAAGVQAPVYFREVLTVLEKLPSDEILIYNLAYGRGNDIPFKPIVRGVIQKQQQSLISELIRSSQ